MCIIVVAIVVHIFFILVYRIYFCWRQLRIRIYEYMCVCVCIPDSSGSHIFQLTYMGHIQFLIKCAQYTLCVECMAKNAEYRTFFIWYCHSHFFFFFFVLMFSFFCLCHDFCGSPHITFRWKFKC